MVRLSFDVEMWHQGITTVPPPAEVRAGIEADLRARLLHLVGGDAEVVLDLSFWSRQMREDWRMMLAPVGVVPETVYFATDRAVAGRLADRRASHSDDYVIAEDLAAHYFEAPTPEQGPLQVVPNSPRAVAQ